MKNFIVALIWVVSIILFIKGHPFIGIGGYFVGGIIASATKGDGGGLGSSCDCAGTPGCY